MEDKATSKVAGMKLKMLENDTGWKVWGVFALDGTQVFEVHTTWRRLGGNQWQISGIDGVDFDLRTPICGPAMRKLVERTVRRIGMGIDAMVGSKKGV